MDDTPATAPLPLVFTESGTSYVDTALAAVAMEKAAHALDWALRGDAAHDAPRWVSPPSIAACRSPSYRSWRHSRARSKPWTTVP